MTSNDNTITITQNTGIEFSKDGISGGDVLILGNFNGICGEVTKMVDGRREIANSVGESAAIDNNMCHLVSALSQGHSIHVVGDSHTVEYFVELVYALLDNFFEDETLARRKQILNHQVFPYKCDFNALIKKAKDGKMSRDDVVSEIMGIIKNMKFDMIVTNPPYSKSLHLDILEGLLDNHLNPTGQLVVIEPSTWLINVRRNGKAKKYDAIKKKIAGHVKSVKIENFNKEFNTTMFVPFSITTIDFSQTYDTIEFECCGEKKVVKSIYDCNLIGDYKTIWSIFDKVLSYGDMMDKHITTEKKEDGMWYAKYPEIVGGIGGALCAATTNLLGGNYDGDAIWKETLFGDYCSSYTSVGYHFYKNEISNHPLFAYDRGKHLLCDRYENGKFIPGKVADNIYGTKEELENWKHFIFNNKLPLFINIVLTIDQHNNSKEFLPWLVDKKYTDEEIYAKFNLTEEEIALIDATLKKFERNSPWFKRYMCGAEKVDGTSNSASDMDEWKKMYEENKLWWM